MKNHFGFKQHHFYIKTSNGRFGDGVENKMEWRKNTIPNMLQQTHFAIYVCSARCYKLCSLLFYLKFVISLNFSSLLSFFRSFVRSFVFLLAQALVWFSLWYYFGFHAKDYVINAIFMRTWCCFNTRVPFMSHSHLFIAHSDSLFSLVFIKSIDCDIHGSRLISANLVHFYSTCTYQLHGGKKRL